MPSSASRFLTRAYYRVKPLLPSKVRWGLRRKRARGILEQNAETWPIDRSAGRKPHGWMGWPDAKEFALVLTHDVESQAGLDRVRPVAELEMEFGLRSSFNFVPEGSYAVPPELREWLVANGFEVGLHDLHHDGRLYDSRKIFRERAKRINHYAESWGAVGFRSGFMLRELDWLHDLDVLYDASTFDTDPFEPQPDGCHTIFPFKVAGRAHSGGGGYVELPYTLPQDSTLFILLGEKSPETWKRKLDWIAGRGGMAMPIVHPDYTRFEGEEVTDETFPVAYYREFLEYATGHYKGRYWQALPREVAQFVAACPDERLSVKVSGRSSSGSANKKPKIWIDLDNTPHVPFFEPIIEELEARGYPILLTARDAFQVCGLADRKGLQYRKIGRHYGKHRLMKGAGLGYRALQLLPLIARERPALGVSHGARSQLMVGNMVQMPTLLLEDYEFSQFPWVMRPTWEMAPEAFRIQKVEGMNGNMRYYPGIKEDVYAWRLKPDAALLAELGLAASDLIVTVRPPATEAHYHNPEAEGLFERFMDRACAEPGVRVVLLPRNRKQEDVIRGRWPGWFENDKTVIPRTAVDGMNLIWHSDLVVSGGGTMNREAAALGVPVYSIFRGATGAVDKQLEAEGRLVMIESLDDVDRHIKLEKRLRSSVHEVASMQTLEAVVDAIVASAEDAISDR